jgi:hypothetical protein
VEETGLEDQALLIEEGNKVVGTREECLNMEILAIEGIEKNLLLWNNFCRTWGSIAMQAHLLVLDDSGFGCAQSMSMETV